MHWVPLFLLFIVFGCHSHRNSSQLSAVENLSSESGLVKSIGQPIAKLPLAQAANQFYTLPVVVDTVDSVAILDTGVGIALVSKALCERINCVIDDELVGKRMSGQEVRVPLTRLDSLSVGGVVERDVIAGVVDIEGFFPEPQIEAFVGLPFFQNRPFTIDGPGRTLSIESEESLVGLLRAGHEIPIRLQRHGPALDTFVKLSVGKGIEAEVLIDTGSQTLILDPRFAKKLHLDFSSPKVLRRQGMDETGNEYTRFYVDLSSPVTFANHPSLSRTGAKVMFQKIIYDGLVGTDFLSDFRVTWDLPKERIIVSK